MSLRPLGLCVALSIATGCVSGVSSPEVSAPPQAARTPSSDITGWWPDVQAISSSRDNAARRDAIRTRLVALGLSARVMGFDHGAEVGQNILADVSGTSDAPLLLIGAHSDRVAKGQGATDNASGSATVLALAQRFKDRPLAKHRVVVAFWDLEESGLLGAKAYVANGSEKPALYVNFDVFGWGDTLWMMAKAPEKSIVAASDAAAKAAGIGFSPGEKYPPTDHLAFQQAGWPAVSYSLVDGSEIGPILDVFSGKQPASIPKVMHVIHSDEDTLDKLEAGDVAKGIDAVEAALRSWDATGG